MSAPLCGVNENGQLEKSYIADGMPIGAVFPFYGTTPPAHTLACNGAAISRTAYAELFAVIGTTAGAGDGSTTFNVPDLRGMFIRGTGGNAAALGVEQGDAIREIAGTFVMRSFGTFANPSPDHKLLFTDANMGATPFAFNNGVQGGTGAIAAGKYDETGSQTGDFRASRVVPTAVENRPVNVAMTYCIVYEN